MVWRWMCVCICVFVFVFVGGYDWWGGGCVMCEYGSDEDVEIGVDVVWWGGALVMVDGCDDIDVYGNDASVVYDNMCYSNISICVCICICVCMC